MRLPSRLVLAVAAGLGLLAVLSVVLGRPSASRVMVLGLDGMDPATVDLLMAEGKLPNFARLRQEGAYGRLRSAPPLLSPILWTTIATGKTPAEHGIGHFTAVDPATGKVLPVTSEMRKVKALWNVYSGAQKKVAVVGWWATWPAEEVHGAMVSDHTCFHFLFPEQAAGDASRDRLTHPPELEARIAPLIRRPTDVKQAEAARYVDVPAPEFEKPFVFEEDLSHFRWALATADSYTRIGLELWKSERPELLMTYIEGTDSTSHLFGHLFRAEGLAGELAEQQRRYGRAVEQMYLKADELLGQFIAGMDDRTTLVVLSDHGFELGAIQDDPSKTRDLRRVSERFHREEGILYLYGHNVKRAARLEQPTIIDVAPTVLALGGIAPAKDMVGRVLTEGLDIKAPERTAETFETAGGTRAAAPRDAAVDAQRLEHLRSLGYLGGGAGAPPASVPPRPGVPRSESGDRNLAAMHFQAGRFREAEQIYRQLLAAHPDDAAVHASLAGVLGATGRYDDALPLLDRAIEIEPLNPEAYHNRAVIQERRGKPTAAIADYRNALRYSPDYEPSRRALTRLTGSAEVNPPRNEAEQKAFALAQQASMAARRGDYAGAAKVLDEAERLAPRYVLVHQYRSNVAYLAGDYAGAARALEKALKIEPDNAFFKRNLERLKQRGGR